MPLTHAETGIEGVALWGLCDAASAAMMYAHKDPRVVGLILANPWMHTEFEEARTRLRHCYLSRLTNRDFWIKLVKGRVDYASSLGSISGYLRQAFGKRPEAGATGGTGDTLHYVERMRRGLEAFPGSVHFILSGKDLTADQFRDLLRGSRAWRSLVQGRADAVVELPAANHTFSSREAKAAVERQTLQWLRDMCASRGGNSS